MGKGSGIVTAVVLVITVAWTQSLAQKLLSATDMAEANKNGKKKQTNKIHICLEIKITLESSHSCAVG